MNVKELTWSFIRQLKNPDLTLGGQLQTLKDQRNKKSVTKMALGLEKNFLN
jgi:hypothetical protein